MKNVDPRVPGLIPDAPACSFQQSPSCDLKWLSQRERNQRQREHRSHHQRTEIQSLLKQAKKTLPGCVSRHESMVHPWIICFGRMLELATTTEKVSIPGVVHEKQLPQLTSVPPGRSSALSAPGCSLESSTVKTHTILCYLKYTRQ